MSEPGVIVDFIFDDGLLFIAIKNVSGKSVFKVSVTFDKKIMGVGGTKEISSLPLFRNIEFMPPDKEIKTFLDSSASYFSREQPLQIATTITYQDSQHIRYSAIINHNLEIYKEIGYIKRFNNI